MPPRRVEAIFPVPPVTIQVCPKIKGLMNHSYRDFSQVPAPPGYRSPTAIQDMTFSQKVHDMLSKPDQYGEYIAWMPHGRAFKVLKPQLFETHVCPLYFGHKRYSSFLRSLNNFGFKHLSRGVDRNCYYHEFMLRGKVHLCQYMPPKRDARRLVADPDHEPDFYRLSQQRPLEPSVPQQQEQHHQQDRSTASVVSSNDCSVAESSLSNSEHGSYHNHGWPMHNVPTACASSMSLDLSIPQGLTRLLQLPTLAAPLVPTTSSTATTTTRATTNPSQMELVVQLLQSHLGQQQQQQPVVPHVNVLTAAIAKALVGLQQQQPPPTPPTTTTVPEHLILCTVALHLLSSKTMTTMPTTSLPLPIVSDKNQNITLATVVWLLQQLLSSSHPSN